MKMSELRWRHCIEYGMSDLNGGVTGRFSRVGRGHSTAGHAGRAQLAQTE